MQMMAQHIVGAPKSNRQAESSAIPRHYPSLRTKIRHYGPSYDDQTMLRIFQAFHKAVEARATSGSAILTI
jgi:hypothetical protein